jgi:hypothetical protein
MQRSFSKRENGDKRLKKRLDMVVHACHPSYTAGIGIGIGIAAQGHPLG